MGRGGRGRDQGGESIGLEGGEGEVVTREGGRGGGGGDQGRGRFRKG